MKRLGLGQAAIHRGRTNQRFLFKPELEKVISIAERHSTYGVCIVHSGSVVGMIIESDADLSELKQSFRANP